MTKAYSGGRSIFPSTNIAGIDTTTLVSNPGLIGSTFDAAFELKAAPVNSDTGTVDCSPNDCPFLTGPSGVPTQVYLKQNRGLYSPAVAETSSVYHAIYGNDNYAFNRYVTFNVGLRWEEEQLNGTTLGYVFVDNWSPRLGINIDPFGDRKSKFFFNWGRYTQSLPQDAALRDLANELDITGANWKPQADANNNVVLNSNGSANPILDAAHLISGDPAAGLVGTRIALSGGASPVFVEHNTKLNFEEEYVTGIERQLGGFVLSARYMDRRLLRVLEDNSGASPEGALGGNIPQNFVIGNLNSKTDYFINEQEQAYTVAEGPPADCPDDYGIQTDSVGNPVGGACGFNADTAGTPIPDGKPDGFANPSATTRRLSWKPTRTSATTSCSA